MKKLLISAVLGAQLVPFAAPARAADLVAGAERQEARMGAFAGGRLRIALGGEGRERVRAGLTVAPALHRAADGATRLRIGEGLEYGLTERRPLGVSLAGYRMADARQAAEGQRHNVSTTGWVAIGVGVVVLTGVAVFGWMVHEGNKQTD
jgi:hypothetical protein